MGESRIYDEQDAAGLHTTPAVIIAAQDGPHDRSTTDIGLALRLTPKSPAEIKAKPSLDGLPEELLEAVLKCLADQSDFVSLCLASRRLHAAAIPHLYREFSHEFYKNPQRLHSFLRSIIKDPKLAGYVQHVEFRDQQKCDLFHDWPSWRNWASKFYKPKPEGEDRRLFTEVAEELQLQKVGSVETIVDSEEAQAALLLSRAVNLTELFMTIPDLNKSRLLLDVLRETTEQGTALQKLRKLTGHHYNFDGNVSGGFELRPVSCLFQLPNIELVSAVACLEPEDDAFRGFDCPEGTSSVTSIDFRRSSVCPKAMSLMIGACRALRSLYCDWGGHTVGWSEINFPTVGAALRKQQHSLEHLTLDVRKHYDVWPEHEDVLIPPLGSFTGFKRLTSIEAPAAALVGWDEGRVNRSPDLHEILPQVIENLTINQWSPGVHEHLERLADVCAARYPRLREITVICTPDDASEETVQALFDSKGASVKIRVVERDEVDHFG